MPDFTRKFFKKAILPLIVLGGNIAFWAMGFSVVQNFKSASDTFSLPSVSAQFAFWIYPDNNDANEMSDLEKKFGFRSGMVGFIYDDFGAVEEKSLQLAVQDLGKDRVFYVTISPLWLSAREVASGVYDLEYLRFFKLAKASGSKFLFRTLHEMNGSWYSWSGDPMSFKRAWKHIYALSRQAGLTEKNILFIMSVNSQDLPSEDGSVNGKMVFCSPETKKKTNCVSFEDYYPGDDYVDLMGMTLYNWGRGRPEDWAVWRTFSNLLNDPQTKMFSRLKSYNKPIFLDEVGTTAVNFSGKWTLQKANSRYRNDSGIKDRWISAMHKEIERNPQIVGLLYFNRDKTGGLQDRSLVGELDWSALSLGTWKQYRSILDFFSDANVSNGALPFRKDRIIKKPITGSLKRSDWTSDWTVNAK